MAESNSIDMNATTGNERDASDIVIPASFTNFARNDDPFFCSWGRDSNANKTETVKKEEDGSLEKTDLTHHVPNPITTDKIIGCNEKDNAPETVKPCGQSTTDSNACKNVAGSNKEKEEASLEKIELTDHVPHPITTDKIIGCKAEKNIAPETVKLCEPSTGPGDSNACKNVTGSNKEKEDGSLKKTESIAVPISDKNFDCKMEKVNAPVNAKECGPSSATPIRNLDMGGSTNVLIKVQDLRPKFNDVNLLVKVVNVKKTCRKGPRRVNVCIVGDETSTIKLRVTNNQVDIVKKGSTLILYKARINMMNDSMELMVPAHGNIQVQQESATFTVKEDNNMSMIKYDEVQVEV